MMTRHPNHMKLQIALVLLASVAWLLVGCGREAGDPEPQPYSPERVSPAAEVRLGADEMVALGLGYINETDQSIAATDEFAGRWVLTHSSGEVRARGEVYVAGPLDPHETSYPLVWEGILDPGTYTLEWGAPGIGTLTAEVNVSGDGAGAGLGRQEVSDAFDLD